MSRKSEQADLLFKLGQLFGPPLKVVENPSSYDQDEKVRIFARYFAEFPKFNQDFYKFTISEDGHDYSVQHHQLSHELHLVRTRMQHHTVESEEFVTQVKASVENAKAAILAVPVPLDSTIYAARTPFSTYCLVKDICSTAKEEIVWLDRYFDQGIFHRYFAHVARDVKIILVTWPQSECKSNKDKQRYQEFMDVSKVFSCERGTDGYRLVTNDDFHDRWLCVDDKLFTLGGSIKDIDKDSTFTISRLDSSTQNRKHFDEVIRNGNEVFGESNTIHP